LRRYTMERGDDAASGAWGGRYKIEHCYKGRLHSCYAQLSGRGLHSSMF
jgi:hypothetical protein